MSSRRDLVGALAALLRLIDISDTVERIRTGAIYRLSRDVLDRAERGLINPVSWTPFMECTSQPPTAAQIKAFTEQHGFTAEQVIAAYASATTGKLFVNSRYQVLVREITNDMVHLSIKRLDQMPIHDWRDLQRCKDELVGPECEAIELYPARARVLDSSNQYHLWAMRNPAFRFPVGFAHGETSSADVADAVGAAQRSMAPE
jgi:hypothetical protein